MCRKNVLTIVVMAMLALAVGQVQAQTQLEGYWPFDGTAWVD
jgi:hypothetical protein